MRKLYLLLPWIGGLLVMSALFSCGGRREAGTFRQADSLNRRAYDYRYKDLSVAEQAASAALRLGAGDASLRAEALNHLAFCAFIRMDFERADSLLREVYEGTANELECLVADVGMMKICQRTARNKEFYDYRNRALRRIKRIGDDEADMQHPDIRHRFNYARSEFAITSSVYYYYLQQEQQSLEAIDGLDVEEVLEKDTAQLLYYYYMKGSGGLYEAETSEEVKVGEFDYLLDCLTLSHETGHVYFEANALQALAELLKSEADFRLLMQRRPGMIRVINQRDLPWEELALRLAGAALELFKQYGDWYQTAGTYRTLASCYNERGEYEKSLDCLSEALSYVNLHHEKFYHCHDTLDRLKPYIPMATNSIELQWINREGIMTVPEWIARFREQLSVTYSALGMKPQSDYNRNIYLDILDYTRQDKEWESRYAALEAESSQLTWMLVLVIFCLVALVVLLWFLNRRWKVRNTLYTDNLKDVLDICRRITSSVSREAEDIEDVKEAILSEVEGRILHLVGASSMTICLSEATSTPVEGQGCVFPLLASDKRMLGEWQVCSEAPLKKDDRALLQVIAPYISWTLENGLSLISLDDERRRLEQEQYVHGRHLVENKRQNLIKKACLFIVMGMTPYIDRVVSEVHKLIAFNYLANPDIKVDKYRYIDELITRINEYNDILAIWIKMRQGSLSLNIENFELNSLFEVLQKGRKNFEQKRLALKVIPTQAVVKADKALTLFMINTLTENARKYTQPGGEVEVYAQEADAYVEISVKDNGPGLSAEDVNRILGEKVYDSGRIGMKTTADAGELRKNKGHGFGLMNCKGIIEKYRKTNDLFRVCSFHIESRVGEGSRFYFRLPKGVRRTLEVLCILLLPLLGGCARHGASLAEEYGADSLRVQMQMGDSLLAEANRLANKVYDANLTGFYQDALMYADSAFQYLNAHYRKYSGQELPLLTLDGEGDAAELSWFAGRFDTDYYTLLDVRNEAAVACLALGVLDAYRYNNGAYTALYKQISEDSSLEEYCEQMQRSANDKTIAIALCILLLLALLLGYYLLYFRHRLTYRYNLEQVFEVNRQALSAPLFGLREGKEIASVLVSGLAGELNELISLEVLGVAVYSAEDHALCYAFSTADGSGEAMKEDMERCFRSGEVLWQADHPQKCLPLQVEAGGEVHRLGVLAFRRAFDSVREDDRLMVELVAGYVSILVYNAVELVEQKYRDIEAAQDEARRLLREENQLHVQNMVLDNCLSTIKHETIYYPNKVKQIIDRLHRGMSDADERQQVETIAELVAYYKDMFTILSSCASRQLEEITFRRGTVEARELAEAAGRYFSRLSRKLPFRLELVTEAQEVKLSGDAVQLKFLLENLINEAAAYTADGRLELHIYREGDFVRFDFTDRRRHLSQEELNQLFYPHLSRVRQTGGEVLSGTEYLICKQVIRDHDEFTGRRGCRMNACMASGGGFTVWCTVPAK